MRKLFPNEFKFFPRSWTWPSEATELKQYMYNKTIKSKQPKSNCDTGRSLKSPRDERQSEKTTDVDTVKSTDKKKK